MKKLGLACVCLLACGGTGSTDIDGGDDGSTNDVVTSNDGSPQDSGGGDASSSDATAKDATSDAGNFNVANVNGLVLWLKGDLSSSITTVAPDGGAPTVSVWADQTSHHNDAKGNAANNLARNPTPKASAINGLAAVHFNKQPNPQANQGQMLTVLNNSDNSLQWSTGDFYIAVVSDFDNNPSDGAVLGVGNFYTKATFGTTSITGPSFYANVPPPANGNPSAGLFFSTANANGDSISTSTGYNNSQPHLFAVRRQSGKMDLFVDGVSVANTTPNAPVDQSNSTVARIGADGDANLVRLDGDIGEMIAVKDVLSSSDQLGIEGYLKAKWNTP